jgi:Na+/proline symporter
MTTTAPTTRGVPTGAPPTPGEPVRRQPSGSSITLTGRGGIVVIFGIALVGSVLGSESLLGIGQLAGVFFVIGCVLAALTTRTADLLTVAVTPPVVFFLVAIIASIVDALGSGSLLRGVFVGIVTVLATGAPWLFLGTLLVLVITIPRGLLTNLRELRSRLVGRRLFEDDDYDDDPVRWDEPRP